MSEIHYFKTYWKGCNCSPQLLVDNNNALFGGTKYLFRVHSYILTETLFAIYEKVGYNLLKFNDLCILYLHQFFPYLTRDQNLFNILSSHHFTWHAKNVYQTVAECWPVSRRSVLMSPVSQWTLFRILSMLSARMCQEKGARTGSVESWPSLQCVHYWEQIINLECESSTYCQDAPSSPASPTPCSCSRTVSRCSSWIQDCSWSRRRSSWDEEEADWSWGDTCCSRR